MQRKYFCTFVLTIINGLNFMDRNTIAGVLSDIQDYFDISDTNAGLIQTTFFCFYMFSAPLFGYLGDRYNRKYIIIVGMIIWNLAVLGSSFMPRNKFWLFLIMRGVVGIGEGSFSIIAPTIIADYFGSFRRAQMLTMFYVTSGVGAGLGFVVGSNVANAANDWRWGVRVGPFIGIIGLIMVTIFVYEPGRGAADLEEIDEIPEKAVKPIVKTVQNKDPYWSDVLNIMKNPTYVLCSVGNLMNLLVTATLSWWAPTAFINARAAIKGFNSTDDLTAAQKDEITLMFGAITVVASLVGVILGTVLSQKLEKSTLPSLAKWRPRADPLICALGAIIGTPTMLGGLLLSKDHLSVTFVLIFIMIVGIAFPWALNTNQTLRVVAPQRRSVAQAWQIMFAHLLGDAPGPWIVGMISDWLRNGKTGPNDRWHALTIALLLPNLICGISAIFFALSSITIVRDLKIVQDELDAAAKILEKEQDYSIERSLGNDNDAFEFKEKF